MALQTTGAISLNNIQSEFGGTTPIAISEYTKAPNGLVPNTTLNAAVDAGPPVNGTSPGVGGSVMAFSDYYGTAVEVLSVTSATLSPSSRAEGQSFTLTVNTSSAPNGTVLYWTMVGTGTYPATGADVGSDTGTITINSNTGSVTITTSDNIESTASPNVQFYIQIRKDSLSGTVLATTNTATITEVWDSIALSSHSISTNTAGLSGTASSTFQLRSDGFARSVGSWTSTSGANTIDGASYGSGVGTTYTNEWWVSGQNKAQYSVKGTWSGSGGTIAGPTAGTWVSLGSATRTWTLETSGTNATRSVAIEIAPTSDTGTILASGTITLTANSTVYTASITSVTPTTVSESSSFTVVVNTSGVPSGTTLYWTLLGTGTNPADSSDLTQGGSGSFVTTGNSTSLSFTAAANADSPYAQANTLQIQIRSGSTSGAVLATTGTITINDNVIFTPDGGASSSTRVYLSDEDVETTVSITVSCNQTAVWNWTRTVLIGLYNAVPNVANGGSATSITFTIPGALATRSATWSLQGTAGGVTRYWTVYLFMEGLTAVVTL